MEVGFLISKTGGNREKRKGGQMFFYWEIEKLSLTKDGISVAFL